MRAFRHNLGRWAVVAVLLTVGRGMAQGPTISSSSVGYIDPAIPANMFRLRFDAAYDDHFPTRGEFLLARSPSPGLPLAERRVDYQETSAYSEIALDPQLSLFSMVPYRFLNPEVNRNHSGLSDVSAGFKWALIFEQSTVATLQFVATAPTGDANRGLGTDHVSLEPCLLMYQGLGGGLALEGEARYLIPIGGSSGYESSVLTYGLGLKFDVYADEELAISPVVEGVGWTFIDGKKTLVLADGSGLDVSASGDTIVNIKAGLRLRLGALGDLYTGYGRALTGDARYREMYRAEWRLAF